MILKKDNILDKSSIYRYFPGIFLTVVDALTVPNFIPLNPYKF